MPTSTTELIPEIPESVIIDPQTPDHCVSAGYYEELAKAPVAELFGFKDSGPHYSETSTGKLQSPFGD